MWRRKCAVSVYVSNNLPQPWPEKKKQNKRKSPKTITRKSATSVLLLFFCFFQTGGSGKKMKTNSLTKKRELLNGIRHELTLVSQRHWTSSGWKSPRSGQLQIITKKKKISKRYNVATDWKLTVRCSQAEVHPLSLSRWQRTHNRR